ncbi:MAG: DUF881 domain-containing protein [Anaerovoracaceae bacterium]|jgi:uncharacterized protein YlxW (UPF0749 family)
MKRREVFIFLFSLLLGFTLIVLAKMSNGQHLYVSPKVLDDYKITIAGEKKDTENLETLISETQAKIEEYEKMAIANEDITRQLEQQLYSDLDLYRLAGGNSAAQGPGVIVYIDDGDRELEFWEDPNDILVHDRDLLLIINELKAAGAEIISINDQRLVDITSISCSGYTVRINGQFFARPFVIKAIGDGSRMSASLIGPGGYGTYLRDWGLEFKVTVVDDIVIPKYSEEHSYKYMDDIAVQKEKEGERN